MDICFPRKCPNPTVRSKGFFFSFFRMIIGVWPILQISQKKKKNAKKKKNVFQFKSETVKPARDVTSPETSYASAFTPKINR